MRIRPSLIFALVRKDIARLLRNGPALMLLGLFIVVSLLFASSGLVEEKDQENVTSTTTEKRALSWIVYWDDSPWIEFLKKRAPKKLAIRFVPASQIDTDAYPPNICVVEIHKYDEDRRGQIRRPITYRYPGSNPNVLWPVTRWFLSASLKHFGEEPALFEQTMPLSPTTRGAQTRAALENVSVADVLNFPLIMTTMLTTIQFFAACGLMVSLTAQERERGALRALLQTPASYFEFIASKAIVHGGLALGTSAIVVGILQPITLSSLLFWATMVAQICGYFSVGLFITCYAKNQTAPNLLSFAYLMAIGTLNLLSVRFQAFQILSAFTFERYGLFLTLASVNPDGLSIEDSLSVMRSPLFHMLVFLSNGLLLIATFVGSRRLRA